MARFRSNLAWQVRIFYISWISTAYTVYNTVLTGNDVSRWPTRRETRLPILYPYPTIYKRQSVSGSLADWLADSLIE